MTLKIFFKAWLRLWGRWQWWAFIIAPYLIMSLCEGHAVYPTWTLPLVIVLVSFFFTLLGWAYAVVMMNSSE